MLIMSFTQPYDSSYTGRTILLKSISSEIVLFIDNCIRFKTVLGWFHQAKLKKNINYRVAYLKRLIRKTSEGEKRNQLTPALSNSTLSQTRFKHTYC